MSSTSRIREVPAVPLGRRLILGLAVGLVAAGVVHWAGSSAFLRSIELETLDWRQRAFGRPSAASERVVVVLVDEESIRRATATFGSEYYSWPWPRDVYAPLIGYLQESGARVIALDLLFSDPWRTRALDEVFAAAAADHGNVVFACKLGSDDRDAGREKEALQKAAVPVDGWTFPLRDGLSNLEPPIEELTGAARAVGAVNVRSDPDTALRRADLLYAYPDASSAIASLAFAAALAGLESPARPRVEGGELVVGERRLPLGRDGRALVRFYGGVQTIRTESAISVIESGIALEEGQTPVVPRETFRDRIVFVGTNAAGIEDIVPAPVSDRYPGAEFQATVCANVLGAEFLRELDPTGRLLLLLAAGALAGLVLFAGRRPWIALGLAAVLGTLHGGLAALLYRRGVVVEVFLPSLVVVGVAVAQTVHAYLVEGRRRREVAKAFRQYLSPAVIRELLRDPSRLRLGGETRRITAYFSDIRGFSTFSEGMAPSDLVSFLNEYLSAMSDVILDRRGVVDKYEGDLIMAFWNAPLPVPDHALEACRTVVEQREILRGLNERFRLQGRPPLDFRAGIHTGPAVVGNMGSSRRFNYTAMGDTVNLASRLEGANKFFGTRVLITEATRAEAGSSLVIRRLGRVQVVGRKEPVEVHELLGLTADLEPARALRIEAYHDALDLLTAGDLDAAEAKWRSLSAEGPDDVVDTWLRRIENLRASGLSWDGVWRLTEKG